MEKIPNEADWEDWRDDLDQEWAHEQLFGLSSKEAQIKYTTMNPVDIGESLRFMASTPFRYYLLSFAEYVRSLQRTHSARAASAANVFLGVIHEKLESDPDVLLPILSVLFPTIETVSNSQNEFDAPEYIYGSFKERGQAIIRLANELLKRGRR